VLTSYIFPLVEKLKTKGLISRWFWIRYNDPDYHLRLRLRIRPGSGATVLKLLTVTLRKASEPKLVSHFQSATYNRELERYSPDLIGLVENVFQSSSELIAPWLREQTETNYEDQAMMIRAVQSSVAILDAFGLTLEEKVAFSKNTFDGFFQEFAAPKTLKGEMERLYRELSASVLFNEENRDEFSPLQNSIQQIVKKPGLNKCRTVTLEKLAGDLIHMHVNRLFIYEQRYFEMVHYFLLYRILSRQLHKTVSKSAPL
jgi:thiopeptide-type bacteriocin biosynthesis protein